MEKETIRPLYSELQGYLSQAPDAATATDASGNTVSSRSQTFATAHEPDDAGPTVRLIDPGVVRDSMTIRAEADDNVGVERVEFLIGGEVRHIDYSPPYDMWQYNKTINKIYRRILTRRKTDMTQRVAAASKYFLGRPYLLEPLGEGYEGVFDQSPYIVPMHLIVLILMTLLLRWQSRKI